MPSPIPKSREKRANDFISNAYETKESRNRSAGDSGPAGTNCAKIETRNSFSKLIMSTPKSAIPLSVSIGEMRSVGATAVGGALEEIRGKGTLTAFAKDLRHETHNLRN